MKSASPWSSVDLSFFNDGPCSTPGPGTVLSSVAETGSWVRGALLNARPEPESALPKKAGPGLKALLWEQAFLLANTPKISTRLRG